MVGLVLKGRQILVTRAAARAAAKKAAEVAKKKATEAAARAAASKAPEIAAGAAIGVGIAETIDAAKDAEDVFDQKNTTACLDCGPSNTANTNPDEVGSSSTETVNNGPAGASDTGGQESVENDSTMVTPNNGSAGATVYNSEEADNLPALDSTGKVHGKLPKRQDLDKYSPDELSQLQDELRQSVKQRIRKNIELGSDKAHGERQADEQQLIKDIDKHLSGS